MTKGKKNYTFLLGIKMYTLKNVPALLLSVYQGPQ